MVPTFMWNDLSQEMVPKCKFPRILQCSHSKDRPNTKTEVNTAQSAGQSPPGNISCHKPIRTQNKGNATM